VIEVSERTETFLYFIEVILEASVSHFDDFRLERLVGLLFFDVSATTSDTFVLET
jgi:hypothetical protein